MPFCARRCAYCDFAIAVRRDVPVDEYVGGAARASSRCASAAPASDRTLDTLYFGGGTPSRLGGDGVARMLDAACATRATLAPDAEVTLEANPEDVDAGRGPRVARGRRQPRLARRADASTSAVLAWMHRVARRGAAIERAVERAREAASTTSRST